MARICVSRYATPVSRTEVLSRIFRAFERADDISYDGLGLGLFIVKRSADLLGDRIKVRLALGRGSCFMLTARAAARVSLPPRRTGCRLAHRDRSRFNHTSAAGDVHAAGPHSSCISSVVAMAVSRSRRNETS